ncbi:hypothetical protein A2U01_0049188, partial [Trifolium medium]|nr:hypothetical protein [Trifolium medium]
AASFRCGIDASNPPEYICCSWSHLIRSLLSDFGPEAFLLLSA